MTRAEAERIIAQIRDDEISPYFTRHVRERLRARDYFRDDLLRGRCLQGRSTIVVLGLRTDGRCSYVTIMTEAEFLSEEARRTR